MKDNLFDNMREELLVSLGKSEGDADLSPDKLNKIWEAMLDTDHMLLTYSDTEMIPNKNKFNDLKEKIESILEGES